MAPGYSKLMSYKSLDTSRGWYKALTSDTSASISIDYSNYSSIVNDYTTACSGYNYTTSSTSYWIDPNSYDFEWYPCDKKRGIIRPKNPEVRLREIIRSRHAPTIITSRSPVEEPEDVREIRARETLRRVLGDVKFQKFMRDGFISVRAKSGLIYQIFPGHGMTNVFDQGTQIDKLCVVLKGDFPPTDSLIMRYLLILNDEREFRKYAIKHGFRSKTQVADNQDNNLIIPLNEIWKDIKAA